MTETNQVTSNLLPKNGKRKPGSVGKPLPGIEVRRRRGASRAIADPGHRTC